VQPVARTDLCGGRGEISVPTATELGGASSGGYPGYAGRAANVVATAARDPQRT